MVSYPRTYDRGTHSMYNIAANRMSIAKPSPARHFRLRPNPKLTHSPARHFRLRPNPKLTQFPQLRHDHLNASQRAKKSSFHLPSSENRPRTCPCRRPIGPTSSVGRPLTWAGGHRILFIQPTPFSRRRRRRMRRMKRSRMLMRRRRRTRPRLGGGGI